MYAGRVPWSLDKILCSLRDFLSRHSVKNSSHARFKRGSGLAPLIRLFHSQQILLLENLALRQPLGRWPTQAWFWLVWEIGRALTDIVLGLK